MLSALIRPLNLDKHTIGMDIDWPTAAHPDDLGYDPGNLLIARKILAFEPTLDEHSGLRRVDFEVFHWTNLLVMSYYPII